MRIISHPSLDFLLEYSYDLEVLQLMATAIVPLRGEHYPCQTPRAKRGRGWYHPREGRILLYHRPRHPPMSNSALPDFLQRRARLPLLTAEEERSLAAEMRQGSLKARDTLVERNVRLAVKWASKYSKNGVPLDMLIQAGLAGMAEGVERYDPEAGRFTTYITFWIKKGIFDWFRKENLIRIPVNLRNYIAKHTDEELEKLLKEDPPDLAYSKESISSAVRLMRESQVIPLDYVSGSENGSVTPLESREEEAPVELEELRDLYELLEEHLAELEPREGEVVRLRFGFTQDGESRTLKEIGEMMRVSKERVRQIQKVALKKLRLRLEGLIHPYLDPDEPAPR